MNPTAQYFASDPVPSDPAYLRSRFKSRIFKCEDGQIARKVGVVYGSSEEDCRQRGKEIIERKIRLDQPPSTPAVDRFDIGVATPSQLLVPGPMERFQCEVRALDAVGRIVRVVKIVYGRTERHAEFKALHTSIRLNFEARPDRPVFYAGAAVGPIVGLNNHYQCRIFKRTGAGLDSEAEVIDVIESNNKQLVEKTAAEVVEKVRREWEAQNCARSASPAHFSNTTDIEALRSSIENAHRELDNSGLIGCRAHTHQGLTNRVKAVISIAQSRIYR